MEIWLAGRVANRDLKFVADVQSEFWLYHLFVIAAVQMIAVLLTVVLLIAVQVAAIKLASVPTNILLANVVQLDV